MERLDPLLTMTTHTAGALNFANAQTITTITLARIIVDVRNVRVTAGQIMIVMLTCAAGFKRNQQSLCLVVALLNPQNTCTA